MGYARQVELDHAVLVGAVADGSIEARSAL
jgi:hypothetical protein